MSLYVFFLYKYQELIMKECFQTHFQAMITWKKIGNISPWVMIAAISSFCFIRCLFWMEYTQYYSSKKVAAILLEKVCNLLSGKLKWSSFIICFKINIKSGLYSQAESLEYKLNMCIAVCLWIVHFESMFFSLTPENFKNGNVFQVFKV